MLSVKRIDVKKKQCSENVLHIILLLQLLKFLKFTMLIYNINLYIIGFVKNGYNL